jgi:MerR family copper efflux transcriptional regulator
MHIGQLASQAGVPIDTVRYYERNGLLPPPPRRMSGYRDFPSRDVERLRFVRRAKALGFSLGEIRDLLSLAERRDGDLTELTELAAAKLANVEHKLSELVLIRDGLRELMSACRGQGSTGACPILGRLTGERP